MRCRSTRWRGGSYLICAWLLTITTAAGSGATEASPAQPADPHPPAIDVGRSSTDAHTSATSGGGADWLLISGVALGAVALGFGVTYGVAVARVNALEGDTEFQGYRARVPASMDSCEAARSGTPIEATTAEQAAHVVDVCDEAHTMETLEAVSVPLGILSGLSAAVLILMSDTVSSSPERAAGWRLSPILGPEVAGGGLSVRF